MGETQIYLYPSLKPMPPFLKFSLVQSLSRIGLLRPHGLQHTRPRGEVNSQSLPKLVSTELVMPSNHLSLCPHFLLLPLILSSIGVLSNESVPCTRWPNHWSFSISPSKEYSGLISFRMDWLDLLTVQGFSRVLQHYSSKATIFQGSAFFIVQLSYP